MQLRSPGKFVDESLRNAKNHGMGSYRFHQRVRGNRPEGLSSVRHEQAHLSEELRVLQAPHAPCLITQVVANSDYL